MRLLFFFMIFFLGIPINANSHGGGLNKEGCHKNTETSFYHCHAKSSQDSENTFNEDYFNRKLARVLDGNYQVKHTYVFDSHNLSASGIIYVDIETNNFVIEGGLDKRSSLDSIQQAVFASAITNKKPAVAIYDTDETWGRFEHRIHTACKKLGIKFYWVVKNEIFEM